MKTIFSRMCLQRRTARHGKTDRLRFLGTISTFRFRNPSCISRQGMDRDGAAAHHVDSEGMTVQQGHACQRLGVYRLDFDETRTAIPDHGRAINVE